MKLIKTVQTRQEAEVIKSYLKANDVEAFITADDRGGATPFPLSPTTLRVGIYVSPDDFTKAKELLTLET